MFFRLKKSGERGYVQIVENKRECAAVRQRVIANLGRADELAASGALASLLASGAKLTDQVLLINALDEDADGALSASAKRIGGPWPCCTEASKGATAPSWNHLRNADEIGLPEFTHSVERFDRDGNFGHTASVFARLQGISDDALVATDRRFNFRAPVVAGRLLPVHSPVRIDGENM